MIIIIITTTGHSTNYFLSEYSFTEQNRMKEDKRRDGAWVFSEAEKLGNEKTEIRNVRSLEKSGN